ncbi:hypothetical protein [Flavilitoribacter nigricans]|uniref:Uncharacterized protein n=1 Tax=Flavilitoribacter nigricans (strain ATCC 23147 / DSM 23189 / NBRC 102662 / NCIMB 1420 / SS-2) TaxID=1122177 RepID=A0A2D0N102_FLAN2|nr:hypothetical protein [Flavilitoribacter nigricans]PHN02175.1 hypothetical protein CRP01_33095 [Flavilitoribacter nigricans DSM 23189 = NBRC 102662]
MNIYTDKTQENKNQSVAGCIFQKQSSSKSTFQFIDNRSQVFQKRKFQEMANNHIQKNPLQYIDNRPETIIQRKLKEMANNTPQVYQLKASQDNQQTKRTIPFRVNLSPKLSKVEKTVVQRYPISTKETSPHFSSTRGRPSERNRKTVREAILDDIISKGPKNDLEKKLISSQAEKDSFLNGAWLSSNNADLCHKNSISDIENVLVRYGNNIMAGGALDLHTQYWVNVVSGGDTHAVSLFQIISDKSQGVQKIGRAINDLIKLLDSSAANYYPGINYVNRSVSFRPDPHVDMTTVADEGSLTPRSREILDHRKALATSGGYPYTAPRIDVDSYGQWVQTSSAGYVLVDPTQKF